MWEVRCGWFWNYSAVLESTGDAYDLWRCLRWKKYLLLAMQLFKSALLWYKLFTSTLEKMRFVLSPYTNQCLAYKMVNGKQCIIYCFVENFKISQKMPRVVDNIIDIVEKKYWKMVVKPTYVGMDFEFTNDGEVKSKNFIEEPAIFLKHLSTIKWERNGRSLGCQW